MDTIENSLIKGVLTTASPLIKTAIDVLVKPKLQKLRESIITDTKKYYIPTEEHFSEYLHRTYKKVSILNTLVFNNTQKLLKDVFIPLTVIETSNTEKVPTEFEISGFPRELITQHNKILITDTAGMGKSTLMKKIFIDIIDQNSGIPILLELRRLSKGKSILTEIHEQLNSISTEFDSRLLLELINEGGFIFILDGYDEISISDRENVTRDIQSFISKASGKTMNNNFILTSRPEAALKSFGDFQEFKIRPLRKREAFVLLRKYDKQGPISTSLIKKLEESEMDSVNEFLTNPLLVTLLFTAYEHKQVIPFKKHIFYRQVYDANFESHDLTKGDSYMHDKHCGLDIDDFHRVLRYIGFKCLKIQKIEFSKDELLKLIGDAKLFCVGLEFNDSDFLKDILKSVPLFLQDGNYYKWAHKSLQEYFAAQFIYLDSKTKQKEILSKIYDSDEIDKYHNILDLYYDIDYKSFRNIIIHRLLIDFSNHLSQKNNFENTRLKQEDIEVRKTVTFLHSFYLYAGKHDIEIDLNEEISKNKLFAGLYELEYLLAVRIKKIGEFLLGAYRSKKTTILTILTNKKNSLITIPDTQDIEESIDLEHEDFTNGHIILTDEISNPLNRVNIFAKINQYLQRMTGINAGLINIEEAKAIKVKIESDLALEDKSDFLTKDL